MLIKQIWYTLGYKSFSWVQVILYWWSNINLLDLSIREKGFYPIMATFFFILWVCWGGYITRQQLWVNLSIFYTQGVLGQVTPPEDKGNYKYLLSASDIGLFTFLWQSRSFLGNAVWVNCLWSAVLLFLSFKTCKYNIFLVSHHMHTNRAGRPHDSYDSTA